MGDSDGFLLGQTNGFPVGASAGALVGKSEDRTYGPMLLLRDLSLRTLPFDCFAFQKNEILIYEIKIVVFGSCPKALLSAIGPVVATESNFGEVTELDRRRQMSKF